MPLSKLLEQIDAIAVLPGGRHSDKGYVTVQEGGFILHAYFREGSVGFELFGPGSHVPRPEHDAHGKAGVEEIKEAVRLLASGKSPFTYLEEHAIQWSTEWD